MRMSNPSSGCFFSCFFRQSGAVFFLLDLEGYKNVSEELRGKVSCKRFEFFLRFSHFFQKFSQAFVQWLPKSLFLALCKSKGPKTVILVVTAQKPVKNFEKSAKISKKIFEPFRITSKLFRKIFTASKVYYFHNVGYSSPPSVRTLFPKK